MKLWEGLEQELNYNTMVSQRGMLNVFHSDPQRNAYARRGNAMRLHGVDAELLDARPGARACLPFADFDNARFPIRGGADAAARRHGAPRRRGLGLCPRRRRARRRHHRELRGRPASASSRAASRASRPTAASSAPRRSGLPSPATPRGSRALAGLRLPIESHVLQAFVTEGIKPLIDHVVTFGAGHFYVSQSDKGGLVFGGDIDGYNSYAQRGNLPVVEDVCRRRAWRSCPDLGAAAHPAQLGRAARHVDGRLADHRQDRRSTASISIAAGATAASKRRRPPAGAFAHLIAKDEPHPIAAAYPPRPLRHRRA